MSLGFETWRATWRALVMKKDDVALNAMFFLMARDRQDFALQIHAKGSTRMKSVMRSDLEIYKIKAKGAPSAEHMQRKTELVDLFQKNKCNIYRVVEAQKKLRNTFFWIWSCATCLAMLLALLCLLVVNVEAQWIKVVCGIMAIIAPLYLTMTMSALVSEKMVKKSSFFRDLKIFGWLAESNELVERCEEKNSPLSLWNQMKSIIIVTPSSSGDVVVANEIIEKIIQDDTAIADFNTSKWMLELDKAMDETDKTRSLARGQILNQKDAIDYINKLLSFAQSKAYQKDLKKWVMKSEIGKKSYGAPYLLAVLMDGISMAEEAKKNIEKNSKELIDVNKKITAIKGHTTACFKATVEELKFNKDWWKIFNIVFFALRTQSITVVNMLSTELIQHLDLKDLFANGSCNARFPKKMGVVLMDTKAMARFKYFKQDAEALFVTFRNSLTAEMCMVAMENLKKEQLNEDLE